MTNSPITATRREMEQAGWRDARKCQDWRDGRPVLAYRLDHAAAAHRVCFWDDKWSAWMTVPTKHIFKPTHIRLLDTPDTTRLIEYAEALEAVLRDISRHKVVPLHSMTSNQAAHVLADMLAAERDKAANALRENANG